MPWLSTLMAVPVLGAVGVSLVKSDKLAKQLALAISLVVLVLTGVLAAQFNPTSGRASSSPRSTTGFPVSACTTASAWTASRWC